MGLGRALRRGAATRGRALRRIGQGLRRAGRAIARRLGFGRRRAAGGGH
jgi:hypothetical protein